MKELTGILMSSGYVHVNGFDILEAVKTTVFEDCIVLKIFTKGRRSNRRNNFVYVGRNILTGIFPEFAIVERHKRECVRSVQFLAMYDEELKCYVCSIPRGQDYYRTYRTSTSIRKDEEQEVIL